MTPFFAAPAAQFCSTVDTWHWFVLECISCGLKIDLDNSPWSQRLTTGHGRSESVYQD